VQYRSSRITSSIGFAGGGGVGSSFLGITLIFLSLTSISFTCSNHLSLEVFFINNIEPHSASFRTACNCFLYFVIILPRIAAWAIIWAYYEPIAIGKFGDNLKYRLQMAAISKYSAFSPQNEQVFVKRFLIREVYYIELQLAM
jgi:hypothetical protein